MEGYTLLSWLDALLLIFHPKMDGSVVENFVVGQCQIFQVIFRGQGPSQKEWKL